MKATKNQKELGGVAFLREWYEEAARLLHKIDAGETVGTIEFMLCLNAIIDDEMTLYKPDPAEATAMLNKMRLVVASFMGRNSNLVWAKKIRSKYTFNV